MDTNNFEDLCLFEFLVQQLCYLDAGSLDEQYLNSLGPTCVEFTCVGFPTITISEDELVNGGPFQNQTVVFNSGKSGLFSRSSNAIGGLDCKAQIAVARKMPQGSCVPYHVFGIGYLKLSDEFLSVFRCSGTSKCIRADLELINVFQEVSGLCQVFIRLSNLGSAVVTKFNAGNDEKSLFTYRGDKLVSGTSPTQSNKPTC